VSALVLLVYADQTELRRLEQILSDEQYLVATATSFKAASKLLKSIIPDLLVAGTSIGAFSGAQVATLIRRDHPHVRLITGASADDEPGFLSAVQRALGDYRASAAAIRRWRRKRLTEIELRVAQPPARLVDVSYGGCRLLLSDADGPAATIFDVALHVRGIRLKAKRVWSSPAPGTEALWLGAQVVESDPVQIDRWHQFVDSLD